MKIFDKRLFTGLFFVFIAATVVGTISHEFGHYLVAKWLGYTAKMSYASTYWIPVNATAQSLPENSFYITLGGPVQTMLTGTIGLLLLFIHRRSFISIDKLSTGQWVMIFLSLFWLRQAANLVTCLYGYFVAGQFSLRGDELQIANYLYLPNWTILIVTAVIGALVLAVIIFKFIPVKQRFTFIISGLAGGIAGYTFWIILFGKYIMP